jgi:hypothetical protein
MWLANPNQIIATFLIEFGARVPTHRRSIRAILAVESMEVGFTTSNMSRVLRLNYDVDAHIATFYGGEA